MSITEYSPSSVPCQASDADGERGGDRDAEGDATDELRP